MIRNDQERRKAIAVAKRLLKDLTSPEREAQRKARKAARRDRSARIGTTAPEQRQERQRDNAYLAWIRRLPCVVCIHEGGPIGKSQAAHIRAGYPADGWRPTGMQQKPDDHRCAPLCAEHHTDGPGAQHRANERDWWARLGIHPPSLCAALKVTYEADQPGDAVIRQFAAPAARDLTADEVTGPAHARAKRSEPKSQNRNTEGAR